MTRKRSTRYPVAARLCLLAALLASTLPADRGSDHRRDGGDRAPALARSRMSFLDANRGRDGSGSGRDGSGSGRDGSGSGRDGSDREDRACPASAVQRPDEARFDIEAETRALVEGFAAKLEVRFERERGRAEVEVEVENLNFPAGTVLNACRNGMPFGQLTLDARHSARFEIEGEESSATLAAPGDVFEVRLDACGSALSPLLAVRLGGGPATSTASNLRLEGKAQTLFNGFEAELGVKFEQRPDRTRFSAQIENVNLPEGTVLAVCRLGEPLGFVALDAFHFADLNLDSRRGDVIPAMAAGDVIEVRQGSCTGSLVISAVLQ